jgi:hypothetical protein
MLILSRLELGPKNIKCHEWTCCWRWFKRSNLEQLKIMKAIFDKIPSPKFEKFPLSELLLAVRSAVPCSVQTPVVIKRLGGVGDAVWQHEQKLDQGLKLELEWREIEGLSLCSDAAVDELLCILGPVYFGIFDASFMFVQSSDKTLEARLSSKFEDVREVPDTVFEK